MEALSESLKLRACSGGQVVGGSISKPASLADSKTWNKSTTIGTDAGVICIRYEIEAHIHSKLWSFQLCEPPRRATPWAARSIADGKVPPQPTTYWSMVHVVLKNTDFPRQRRSSMVGATFPQTSSLEGPNTCLNERLIRHQCVRLNTHFGLIAAMPVTFTARQKETIMSERSGARRSCQTTSSECAVPADLASRKFSSRLHCLFISGREQ